MNLCNFHCWLIVVFTIIFEFSNGLSSLSSDGVTQQESYPQEMLEKVETTLLSLFGHNKRPPKIDRSKLVIPDEMIRLYELQSGVKFSTSNIPKRAPYLTSANTVRSFKHVESPVDERFQAPHKFRLKFILDIPEQESFQHAELSLHRTALPKLKNGKNLVRILVEDILKPGQKGKHGPLKRIIDSKVLNITYSSTIKLDVGEAVKRWLKDPKNNHGIIVKVLTKSKEKIQHVRLRRDLFNQNDDDDDENWLKSEPLLFTYTDDKKNPSSKNNIKEIAEKLIKRAKRAARHGSAPRRKKSSSSSVCMRHPMYVNFEEVGWDNWIVAPPGYDAYYCHGECKFPLVDHLNSTNHAIVQTMMNSAFPLEVPRVCCIPTQLNPISMLYLDTDKKVVLKNYKDMVVIGCGCH